MDLRCANGILHGRIVDGLLETTCKSARCGKSEGVVVLHRFNLSSGEVTTQLFRDITTRRVKHDASR